MRSRGSATYCFCFIHIFALVRLVVIDASQVENVLILFRFSRWTFPIRCLFLEYIFPFTFRLLSKSLSRILHTYIVWIIGCGHRIFGAKKPILSDEFRDFGFLFVEISGDFIIKFIKYVSSSISRLLPLGPCSFFDLASQIFLHPLLH